MSSIESKIRAATHDDGWKPTEQQLRELAKASHSHKEYPIIMKVIWKRLGDHGKNWKRIYKALLVLEYLLKNGSPSVRTEVTVRRVEIQTLCMFQYSGTFDGKNIGVHVREKAKEILEFIDNPPAPVTAAPPGPSASYPPLQLQPQSQPQPASSSPFPHYQPPPQQQQPPPHAFPPFQGQPPPQTQPPPQQRAFDPFAAPGQPDPFAAPPQHTFSPPPQPYNPPPPQVQPPPGHQLPPPGQYAPGQPPYFPPPGQFPPGQHPPQMQPPPPGQYAPGQPLPPVQPPPPGQYAPGQPPQYGVSPFPYQQTTPGLPPRPPK